MLRRPLHLLASGLLAVATLTTSSTNADEDRAPRLRLGNSASTNNSNTGNVNSGGGQAAPRNPPQLPSGQGNGNAGNAPRGNLGGNTPQLDALRQRMNSANNGGGNSSGGNNVDKSTRGLPNFGNNNNGGNKNNGNRGAGLPKTNTRQLPTNTNIENPATEVLRQRLEQIRQQNANQGDSKPSRIPSGTPGMPNTGSTNNGNPGVRSTGGLNLDQLRERLNGTDKQGTDRNGGTKPAVDSTGNSTRDRFQERFPNGLPGIGNNPTNNVGKNESRKPILSNGTGTELQRLQERFQSQTKSDRDGRFPKLPGGDVGKVGRERIDLTRKGGDRDGLKIERPKLDRGAAEHIELVNRLKESSRIRNPQDLQRKLDTFQGLPEVRNVLAKTNLKVTDLSGAFQTRLHQPRAFDPLIQTTIGKKFHLDQQFAAFHHGDVTRQLNLHQTLIVNGGWAKRSIGPVHAQYTAAHFSHWYPGPAWCPSYCWTPIWSPWVQWCFWDYCLPYYDPRPLFCRPIYYYNPCPPIVYYDYPIWQPLPVVTCGTWVDVPLTVIPAAYDLQLLAVRFVDPGHPEENLGPRYRVWLRNNSQRAIISPFNVMLVAANDQNLLAGLPQAGVTVESLEAEGGVPVDVRLPIEANRMNRGPNGQRIPFTTLHVLVDSHRELPEVDESNNGLVLGRGDILPVDPAAFSTEDPATMPGAMVSLAGEGFGPEPGQLVVTVGNQQQAAEVHGWYDLGIYFKMPLFVVNGPTTAQLLVLRGDGAASNPVTVQLNP